MAVEGNSRRLGFFPNANFGHNDRFAESKTTHARHNFASHSNSAASPSANSSTSSTSSRPTSPSSASESSVDTCVTPFDKEHKFDFREGDDKVRRYPHASPSQDVAATHPGAGLSGSQQVHGVVKAVSLVSLYFALNLALTFYNKSLLNNFPYPYFLTAVHAGSCIAGCFVLQLLGFNAIPTRQARDQIDSDALLSRRGSTLSECESSVKDDDDNDDEKAAFIPSRQSDRSVDIEQGRDCDKPSLVRYVIVVAYSTLYAANIAVSNASLGLVSVPFHQIIRSMCPIFTAILSIALLAKQPSSAVLRALVPVVFGAALSCLGELSFTSKGFLLTLLGTFLAALKTVATNLLQGGGAKTAAQKATTSSAKGAPSKLSLFQRCRTSLSSALGRNVLRYTPLQLLAVMSPLACIQCLLMSASNGELRAVYGRFNTNSPGAVANSVFDPASNFTLDTRLALLLAGNGFIAFALNLVSFQTNRVAGPLAMTVVGNLKQVTTIVMAVQLYSITLGSLNVVGITMAVAGTIWYGVESLKARR